MKLMQECKVCVRKKIWWLHAKYQITSTRLQLEQKLKLLCWHVKTAKHILQILCQLRRLEKAWEKQSPLMLYWFNAWREVNCNHSMVSQRAFCVLCSGLASQMLTKQTSVCTWWSTLCRFLANTLCKQGLRFVHKLTPVSRHLSISVCSRMGAF